MIFSVAREGTTTLLRAQARLVDVVVRNVLAASDLPRGLALVAVGGYGRGQLFPHSDVDVMLLLPHPASEDAGERIEQFLLALWDVGLEVGTPFADREERLHEHAYSGEVTLVAKNIAASNGGNQNGAAAATYPLAGTTKKVASGLPFLQIAGCVKP